MRQSDIILKEKSQFLQGSFFVLSAQIALMVSGYIIHFSTASFVTVEEYSRFGVILSLLMVSQIFLSTGIPNAVSKYTAEGRDTIMLRRKALRLQILLSVIIFSILFISSSFLSKVLNDEELTNYIRFSSFFLLFASISSYYIEVLNGMEEFKSSSLILIIRYISAAGFAIFSLYLGYSIYGVIGGYILGPIIAIIFGYKLSKKNIPGRAIETSEIFNFAYPLIIYALLYSLLLNLDIFLLKFLDIGLDYIGYFIAAKTLGTIPIFVFGAISVTILPVVSRFVSKGQMDEAREIIYLTTRYVLIFLLFFCTIIVQTSEELMILFYPSEYAEGASSLNILVIGSGFFVLFNMFSYIINTLDRTKIPVAIGIIMVISDIFLCYHFIRQSDIVGAAIATSVAAFVGSVIAGIVVIKYFNLQFTKPSLFMKICFAALITYIATLAVSFQGISLLLWYLFLFILYISTLFLLNVFTKDDIKIIKGILQPKPKEVI